MLTSFSLENYRAFPEKTTVELRPLTLLFGYNNVGKSSLIRALALMADSARSSARSVLDLASDAARECDFDDLLSRASGREKLRLGLSFEEGEQIEAEIAQDLQGRRFVSDLRIDKEPGASGGPILISAQWTPEGPYGHSSGYDISVDGSAAGKMGLKFTSLAARVESGTKYEGEAQKARGEAAAKVFSRVAGLVDAMGLHLQWLGSLRRYPPRYGRYLGEAPARMGPDGAGAAEILAYDKLDRGTLLAEVSGWYERCFKRRINVNQSSDRRFTLKLEPIDKATKSQISIADTGEGIAQVLPVLVAAAMARRHGPWDPWTLAIEQPELHLHPAVHAALAREQGYLCGYCGTRVGEKDGDCHIEHFVPQSEPDGKGKSLALDFGNMLASCQGRDEPPAVPAHCGQARGTKKVPVSPFSPDCAAYFIFGSDGRIEPSRETAKEEAARTTIKNLQLDVLRLKAARKAAIDAAIDILLAEPNGDWRAEAARYDIPQAGRLAPFCFAIQEVLLSYA